MSRFCLTLVAPAVLSLAVWSPAALADTTLSYHADGTCTMVTNNGDEFDRITEFDAKGNVTKITWGKITWCRHIHKPKKIVVYNPDGSVRSEDPEPPPPPGKRKWREGETHDRNERYAPLDKEEYPFDGLIDNVIFSYPSLPTPEKPLRRTPGRTYSGNSEDPEPPPPGKREWRPGETHDRNEKYAPDDKSNDKGKDDGKDNTPKSKHSLGGKDSRVFQLQGQSGSLQGGNLAPGKAYSADPLPKCPPAPPKTLPGPGPGGKPGALPLKR